MYRKTDFTTFSVNSLSVPNLTRKENSGSNILIISDLNLKKEYFLKIVFM